MSERVYLEVDPRTLRLPPSRLDGSDLRKLKDQIARFGAGKVGMPDVFVYRDRSGILMIWEGVTRATRLALLSPGTMIRVEVLATKDKDFSRQPKIEDRLPWQIRLD